MSHPSLFVQVYRSLVAKVKRKLWIECAFVDQTLCLSKDAYVIL
jgi:hypothetical protein